MISTNTNIKDHPQEPQSPLTQPTQESKPDGKSARWTNEPDLTISHPEQVQCKKLPKVVVWKDLHVWVPVQNASWFTKQKRKMRCVIKGVSGVAEPGQILAIMGESGAGKTTLLNVLTRRFKKALRIEGEVNVNGELLHPSQMRKISAFVQQFDLFFGSQTVREHLIFCAHLRMSDDVSSEDKVKKVDEVVSKMGLRNCQHTTIGQRFTKSISLGEKKRLSFAAELLNDPSVIFCDEPTSGLDAYMAKQVILCLKRLAVEDGCTVIITIHQPSSQIFELIDRVCLMASGQVCYFGPTKKVPAFFGSIGYQMPAYTNPAEFAIKTLAIQEGEKEPAYRRRIEDIACSYKLSTLAADFLIRTHGPVSERRLVSNEDLRNLSKYNASWCEQFWWLFRRSFFKTLRDPLMIKIRLFQTLLTTGFISLIYFKTELTKETIMNVDGILFNFTRDSYFLYIFPAILVFADELPVYMRETHARIYRTDTYFIAKNLAEMPQFLLLPFIYTTILFFTTGIMDAPASFSWFKWPVFTLIGCISTNHALSIGYWAACTFGRPEVSVQYLPMINLPLLAMAGFFVNFETVKYLWPLKYVSWFRYTFEALMINVWHDRGAIPGCSNNHQLSHACTGTNGTEHLKHNGFNVSYYWVWINVAILVAMAFVTRIIALFALFIRTRLTDA